jgi:CubicO group peptidase (beta-lactamase class C family)
MEQNYIPSTTVAVVRNNSIIWAKGYGEQQSINLIYMTGSVTKTFTATAIFQIYEQGLIDLDDDVNEYLPYSLRHPNFTNTPITIEMLLTHMSGLNKDTEPFEWGMAQDAANRINVTNPFEWLPYPDWIEAHLTSNGSLYIPETWTPYEPGTVREYSNMGYSVLGYILQLATGKPIWDYMQENILDPLEMHSTGYNFSKFDESQLAIPYEYQLEQDPESTGNIAYPHYNLLAYSCGAIRSNIYDLARFLLVHMHKGLSNGTRILEEQTIQRMHELQASWVTGSGGLVHWDGWGGTEGDIYGFHAKAYAIHDGNTTVPYAVITLVNQGHDDARDAAYQITRLLQVYVHQYDVLPTDYTSDIMPLEPIIIFASGVTVAVVLIVLVRRKKS